MRRKHRNGGSLIEIQSLIEDAKCFETVRGIRRPVGVCCQECFTIEIIRYGRKQTQQNRKLYHCKHCGSYFDDLMGTNQESTMSRKI